ncbi:hypothetical protein ABE236_00070 [Priestia endophytica]|uniref:hypothetical protein n=1 Tax=Priestia endophytica TaxID=135735 RepID=UPI003D274EFE
MDLNEVLKRATDDPEFAKKLKSKALQAARKGMDSPEWDEYMAYFNTSPETLARMKMTDDSMMEEAGTTTTTTTITTTTSGACTITTTTTTTTTAR